MENPKGGRALNRGILRRNRRKKTYPDVNGEKKTYPDVNGEWRHTQI